MKKNRWHKFFETEDGRSMSHGTSEVEPQVYPAEILEALKDGVRDGKFKGKNQELLADYFNIEIKTNVRKNGKAKTKR